MAKETIGEAFIRIMADGAAFGRSVRRQVKDNEKDIEKAGSDTDKSFEKGFEKEAKKSTRASNAFLKKFRSDLDESSRHFDTFGTVIDDLAPKLGRIFGKGSRNNAFNFFGSIVQGVVGSLSAFPKFLSGVNQVTAGVVDGFTDAREAGEGFFKSLIGGVSGGIKTLMSFGEAGPAGLIALGAIISLLITLIPAVMTLIGALASALSLAAAAVVALASALSFALVGAIAPLVGLILPLAGAVGVLILAFAGLDKATKKTIATSLAPLKKSLDELRKTASGELLADLPKQAKLLHGTFSAITPLVKGIAGSLRDVFTSFLEGTNSKGFKDFIAIMTKNLPGQITSLGAIFKSALGGFGGIFEALQPSVNTFLENLKTITAQFSTWVNSAKGQASLKDFFEKAQVSAGKVWDIIKQLAVDLGRLIGAGKDTGDSFLDSLLASLKDLGAWLKDNPEALQSWFRGAKEMGHDIGDLAKKVVDLFDKMDTPENRQIAKFIFQTIGGAVVVMGAAFKAVAVPVNFMMTTVLRAFRDIGAAILGFLIQARDMITPFTKLPGAAGAAARGIKSALDGAIGKVETFNGKVDTALRDRNLDIDVTVTDYQKTIAQLAQVRLKVLGIPTAVTIGVNAKISANAHQLLFGDERRPTAAGGMFFGPQRRLIAEAGAEAVVPLDRPLHLVDPAVRSLSAIAQGITPMANGGVVGGGKVVNVGGLTVITPTEDPIAVASEVVNRLVGAAYI